MQSNSTSYHSTTIWNVDSSRGFPSYTVGQDKANSIWRVQYSDSESYPDGEDHPQAEQYHVNIPRDGTPFDFSALFCGIADARHLYASLGDLSINLATINGNPETPIDTRIHFVLVLIGHIPWRIEYWLTQW